MDQLVALKSRAEGSNHLSGLTQHKLVQTLAGNAAFRLFVLSEGVGLFGGHFFQIALPWLIVKVTGSAAAMGTAIFLTGLARIALVMVAGTLSDRFSPRSLILVSNGLRAVILALFLACEAAGWLDLTSLYIFSIAFGITDAISLPARGLIVPRLVVGEQLQSANSIVSGQEKAWGIIGPTMAGLLVAWLNGMVGPGGGPGGKFPGITAAFVLNLLAISALILLVLRLKLPPRILEDAPGGLRPARPARAGSIKELLTLIWREEGLRSLVLLIYGINILSNGPLFIGLPMLAVTRFGNGAQALGVLSSASAGGALLGSLAAGLLPEPPLKQLGKVFLAIVCSLGAGLTGVWLANSLGVITIAVLSITALIGYVNIVGITWIQKKTPAALLGRMMGLLNLK